MTTPKNNTELHALVCELRQSLKPFLSVHTRQENNKHVSFDEIWRHLVSNQALVERAFSAQNRYMHTGYELILINLADELIKNNLLFSPKIKAVTKTKGGPERIFVGVHTGLAPMTKYAMAKGWKISSMSSLPAVAKLYELRTGIRSCEKDIFPVDSNSLMKIRKLAKEDRAIILTADYKGESGLFQYISPGIFKLAAKQALPLYYHATTVNAEGTIELVIKGPFSGDEQSLISMFLEFQMRIRPHATYLVADFEYVGSFAHSVAQEKLRQPSAST